MKKCIKCGCELEDGIKFCGNCGSAQEVPVAPPVVEEKPPVAQTVENTESKTQATVEVPEEEKIFKPWPIIGLGLGVLALLLLRVGGGVISVVMAITGIVFSAIGKKKRFKLYGLGVAGIPVCIVVLVISLVVMMCSGLPRGTSSARDYSHDYDDDDDITYEYDEEEYEDYLDSLFDEYEEDAEEETEAEAEETTAAPETTVSETTSAPDTVAANENGLRAEFKQAMDSYEEFMDRYVEFMKNYNSSPDLGLLVDYYKMLSEYEEFVEDFEEWDDEDLNDAELAYYIEVEARVAQKLLGVV